MTGLKRFRGRKPGRRSGKEGMVDGAFIKFGVLGGHVFTEVGLESTRTKSSAKNY